MTNDPSEPPKHGDQYARYDCNCFLNAHAWLHLHSLSHLSVIYRQSESFLQFLFQVKITLDTLKENILFEATMSILTPLVNYNYAEAGAAQAGSNAIPVELVFPRDPTSSDIYAVGQLWYSTASATLWLLQSVSGGVATWSASTAVITTPLVVADGGTGATTLLDHGVLVGSGTAAITPLAVGSNGQVLVGSTGADPVFATLTSADGTVTFAIGAGTLDLSTSLNADFASPPPIGNVAPNTGAFTTLTSSGASTLGSAGNSAVTLGNATSNATITIGSSTAAHTINIGNAANTAAQVVNISSGTTPSGDSTVNVLNSAYSAGTQTYTLLSGTSTGGTQVINIGRGASPASINIGNSASGAILVTGSAAGGMSFVGTGGTIGLFNDAAANLITLGSTTAGATLTLASALSTSISGAVGATITIGNAAQTGLISIGTTSSTGGVTIGGGVGVQSILFGTGGTGAKTITLGGTAANVVTIANVQTAGSLAMGAAMVGATIAIGGAPMTGQITLGASTAGQTISVGDAINVGAQIVSIAGGASGASSTVSVLAGVATAGTSTLNLNTGTGAITRNTNIGTGAAVVNGINIGGTGANVIAIGNTQTAGSVAIGAAMTTGTITIGGTGLQTGTITLGGGTGAQIVNVATGGTGVKTVHIADSAVANVITIGSLTGAASLTLQSGTGGISLATGATTPGSVSMTPATSSTASATSSVTMNNRVGCATFTGFTTAAAGLQGFTITNSNVLTTSCVLVTVANLNASTNGAEMSLLGVTQAAGSIIVNCKNNGGGALGAGDNVLINFWILS